MNHRRANVMRSIKAQIGMKIVGATGGRAINNRPIEERRAESSIERLPKENGPRGLYNIIEDLHAVRIGIAKIDIHDLSSVRCRRSR
jgi:hypothetical protein